MRLDKAYGAVNRHMAHGISYNRGKLSRCNVASILMRTNMENVEFYEFL